jgi:IS30 family transposase
MQNSNYRRLREEDRYIIYRMRKDRISQQKIARALGCSQSAISKELSRNSGMRGYRPKQAHKTALERPRTKRTRETVIVSEVAFQVFDRLKRKHSHEQVSEALDASGYFCQPYHSWEKGGVENFNGLVRQYYPKGTNFLNISEASLADVEAELNQRPRKTLNFKSPDNLKHKLAA